MTPRQSNNGDEWITILWCKMTSCLFLKINKQNLLYGAPFFSIPWVKNTNTTGRR